MNTYFETARILLRAGKTEEAKLCVQILGWTSIRTRHLVPERSAGLDAILSEHLKGVYAEAKDLAFQNLNWLPTSLEDPWLAKVDVSTAT